MSEQSLIVPPSSEAVSLNMDRILDIQRCGVAWVEKRHPRYLELPQNIASIADDPHYVAALPHGRFEFYVDQYVYVDEINELRYAPWFYTLAEIGELVDQGIRIPDRRVAAMVPLAWRVGFVVGWLSGVAVAQPDDAKAGMTLLNVFVAPLLPGNQQTPRLNADFSKKGKRIRK
jgi:hypothetical protein